MLLFDNPAQAAGLVAFLAAFVCCLVAGRTGGWLWLAVIYLALAVEMVVETRHELRLLVNDLMQQGGLYSARGEYQLIIAGLVTIVVLLTIYQLLRSGLWKQSSSAGKRAWTATIVLLLLFAVEFLSVHAIDALLYQTIGGLMRIAWFWLALAGITGISAIMHARRSGLRNSDLERIDS